MFRAGITACVIALAGSAATAATISGQLEIRVEDQTRTGVLTDVERATTGAPEFNTVRSGEVDVAQGEATGSGSFAVDPVTGSLQVEHTHFVPEQDPGLRGSARSSSTFTIRETFVAGADGQVTMEMGLVGFIGVDDWRDNGINGAFFQGSLAILDRFGRLVGYSDFDIGVGFRIGIQEELLSSAFDDIVRLTVDVVAGETYSMVWGYQTFHETSFRGLTDYQKPALSGRFELMANMCYERSESLASTFNELGFASTCEETPYDNGGPGGDTSVVPLPAGLPLLLAGVGALGVLRRHGTGGT